MAYKCPYDPKLRYFNRHCNEMQRTKIRVWCKECIFFTNKKKKAEEKDG